VESSRVGFRKDGDRRDVQVTAGANDSHCDFPAICNQYFAEHEKAWFLVLGTWYFVLGTSPHSAGMLNRNQKVKVLSTKHKVQQRDYAGLGISDNQ
jgi:hypothetical protein